MMVSPFLKVTSKVKVMGDEVATLIVAITGPATELEAVSKTVIIEPATGAVTVSVWSVPGKAAYVVEATTASTEYTYVGI